MLKTFKYQLKEIGQLFGFLFKRKKWELIPIVVLLIIIGLILLAAQSPIIAPLIYTVF